MRANEPIGAIGRSGGKVLVFGCQTPFLIANIDALDASTSSPVWSRDVAIYDLVGARQMLRRPKKDGDLP